MHLASLAFVFCNPYARLHQPAFLFFCHRTFDIAPYHLRPYVNPVPQGFIRSIRQISTMR
jgi:hypothetical protein